MDCGCRAGTLAGQAFRPYVCQRCHGEFNHPNTNIPKLCVECSDKLKQCQFCLVTIDDEVSETEFWRLYRQDQKEEAARRRSVASEQFEACRVRCERLDITVVQHGDDQYNFRWKTFVYSFYPGNCRIYAHRNGQGVRGPRLEPETFDLDGVAEALIRARNS